MNMDIGTSVPYIKHPQRHTCTKWSEEELQTLRTHPEMTSRELSEILPGRSALAIRHMRARYGRWQAAVPICSVCGQRIVWTESARAKAMGLCKGCYLHEMEHRRREDARANALRQSLFKEKRRRQC